MTTSSPHFFSNPLWFWYQKFNHIFMTLVVKFGVHIPNTLGEINGNVAWKLENVVTTQNKTINNISIFFLLLLNKIQVCNFFIVNDIFRWNWPYVQVLARLFFQNVHVKHLTIQVLYRITTLCLKYVRYINYLKPVTMSTSDSFCLITSHLLHNVCQIKNKIKTKSKKKKKYVNN